jgi:hypothetical protein
MSSGRVILMVLGVVAGLFLIGQLILGQLILSGRVNLVKAHQHSGYTTVVLSLVYVVLSLRALSKRS